MENKEAKGVVQKLKRKMENLVKGKQKNVVVTGLPTDIKDPKIPLCLAKKSGI